MKNTYKPFVRDGELWGKQLNPYGVNHFISEDGYINDPICHKEWQQAEQSLQSFKVDKSEYWNDNGDLFYKPEKDAPDFCRLVTDADTFRATLKDNTLINLEVL